MTMPGGAEMADLMMIVVKGTLLLVAAILLAVVLRRAPAGARHLVWFATLATVLLFPVLARWEPLRLEVLPPLVARFVPAAPAAQPAAITAQPTPGTSSDNVQSLPSASGTEDSPVAEGFTLPGIGTLLLLAWLAGTVVLLGWLALGVVAVRRIIDGGRALVDPKWTRPLYEVADRMNLDTVPQLIASTRVEMPFACGIVRPTIVFPESAEGWSDDRRRVVLFHELAHIHRRDLIGHTLGRFACALYWFHPLVWTAARQLRAESERACDDLVLACGARASDYVAHLLDIVTGVRHSGAPVTALPMARKKEFEGRMLAILDPSIPRGTPGRIQSAGILLTVAFITLAVAAAAPTTTVVAAPVDAIAADAIAADTTRPDRDTVVIADKPLPLAIEHPQPRPIVQSTVTERATQSVVREEKRETLEATTDEPSVKSAPPSQGDRIEALVKILSTDSDTEVRTAAAWALEKTRDPRAVAALRTALRADAKSTVREMAAWALIQSGGATSSVLVDALRDDDSDEVRETAAWGLGQIGATDAAPALVRAIRDESSEVRRTAIWALGTMKSREPATSIAQALNDADDEVRLQAAWALGQLLAPATIPALRSAFASEKDAEVRQAIFRALAFMGDESDEFIALAMKSPDPELRSRAVRMLAGRGPGIWPWPWPWPRPRPSI